MIRVNKYFIPYVIFLIIVGYKGNLIYAFFIVIIHEGVHYLTAKHYNFSGFDIELIAFGASIKLKWGGGAALRLACGDDHRGNPGDCGRSVPLLAAA